VSLQTREHNFGVILFSARGTADVRFFKLAAADRLALQIALTLENYVVMHEAQRRTKEYELLTEIGQPSVLISTRTKCCARYTWNWARFSDTNNFYIAFQEEDEIHFELEIEGAWFSQALAQGQQWID